MLSKFIALEKSLNPNKRFALVVLSPNGKIRRHNFGSPDGQTFIDHGDKKIKEAWLARHSKIKSGKRLAEVVWESNAFAPTTLSKWILWGDSPSLEKNLRKYRERFNLL